MEKIAPSSLFQKCTSRKFLVSIMGAATSLVVAFHPDGLTQQQLEAVQNATYLLMAYVIGEGMADGLSPTNKSDETTLTTQSEESTYG